MEQVTHAFIAHADFSSDKDFKVLVQSLAKALMLLSSLAHTFDPSAFPVKVSIRKARYRHYKLNDFAGLSVSIHEKALAFNKKNPSCFDFYHVRGYHLIIKPDLFDFSGRNMSQADVIGRLKQLIELYFKRYLENKPTSDYLIWETLPE